MIQLGEMQRGNDEITFSEKKLGQLFGIDNQDNTDILKGLSIPDYQRAYEWKSTHVKSLLADTFNAYNSSKERPYLMGTLILHLKTQNGNGKETHKIVDGQQRLITLVILLRHILGEKANNLPLLEDIFDNRKSAFYLRNTKREVTAFLNNKAVEEKEEYLEFLKKQLKFYVLILTGDNALDQAYTFFDSLNSKGKSLSDFDLLKAHHLMFIPDEQESLARKHNDYWMSKHEQHSQLFSSVLRRIRMWSRGQERDSVAERNDYNEFISAVEPSEIERNEHLFNRYMQPNAFRSWHRENDELVLNMKYPQQDIESLLPMEIPQTIEGGDSFFLYAKRYHEMFEKLFEDTPSEKKSSTMKYVYELAKAITNVHLAMAFKAVVLLHFDKFGEQRLAEVATCAELILSEIRFRWGNTRVSPVKIETTLKWVKDNNIIPIILNSTISSHVVSQLSAFIDASFREIKDKNNKDKDNQTLKSYREPIYNFYKKNKSKIRNDYVLKLVVGAYFPKGENHEN